MCSCSDCVDYNRILSSKLLWTVVSEQLLKSLSGHGGLWAVSNDLCLSLSLSLSHTQYYI